MQVNCAGQQDRIYSMRAVLVKSLYQNEIVVLPTEAAITVEANRNDVAPRVDPG
jgi:hypothetical protein